MKFNAKGLEKTLGVTFKDKELLQCAFTHRSFLNENPKHTGDHNERLEFLGDAVLELVVTDYLYNNYPNPEGDLTNWRASLVNSKMLSRVGGELDFGQFILLSKGESKDEGRARQYILANAYEALVGALYLDQGYEPAREFIEKTVLKHLDEILDSKSYLDPKSHFQEKSQGKMGITPSYEVSKEWGPDHKKEFKVGVYLEEELVAEGEGFSKQSAQEEAARKALEVKKWI